MNEAIIEWTDYMLYRASLRGFHLVQIEEIVRYSSERYLDNATGSLIAVSRDAGKLLLVAYEAESGILRPITAHATTRSQIQARIGSGRYTP